MDAAVSGRNASDRRITPLPDLSFLLIFLAMALLSIMASTLRLGFALLFLSSCQIVVAPCFGHDPACQPWGPLLFSGLSRPSGQPLETIYYLTATGNLERLHRDGIMHTEIRTGISSPVSIARDDEGDQLFWPESNNDIWVQNSSGVSTILSGYYGGLYFHSNDRFLYMNEPGALEFRRSQADGTGTEILHFSSSAAEDARFVVDAAGTYAYFARTSANSIGKLLLDGGVSSTNLVLGLSGPAGICVNFDAGLMYWVERTGNRLQRANLDGTNVTLLLSGLNDPKALGCDFVSGLLYIGEETGARLLKVDLSGNILAVLVQAVQIRDLVLGR